MPDALAAPFPLRPVRCGKKLKEANAGEAYLPQFHDRYLLSIFSLKLTAFQTIRPVVSRKKRGFSAHFGPGGAAAASRFTFFKFKALLINSSRDKHTFLVLFFRKFYITTTNSTLKKHIID